MRIDSPILSGSISQGPDSYSNLSGSFTGSFIGDNAILDTIQIPDSVKMVSSTQVPLEVTGSIGISGSLNVTDGSVTVDGVNLIDSAIAFSIALG